MSRMNKQFNLPSRGKGRGRGKPDVSTKPYPAIPSEVRRVTCKTDPVSSQMDRLSLSSDSDSSQVRCEQQHSSEMTKYMIGTEKPLRENEMTTCMIRSEKQLCDDENTKYMIRSDRASPMTLEKGQDEMDTDPPDTDKLQSEMGAAAASSSKGWMEERGPLVKLPDRGLFELLTCIRCGNVPSPRNYLVCPENGHHLCGPCAFGPTEDYPNLGVFDENKDYFPTKVLGTCCERWKLAKGSPMLLEIAIGVGIWKCQNWEFGCSEIVKGYDMDTHLETCKFGPETRNEGRAKVPCYVLNCNVWINKGSVETLMEHYETHWIPLSKLTTTTEFKEIPLQGTFTGLLEQRHLFLVSLVDKMWDSFAIICSEVCKETETLHIWASLLSLMGTDPNENSYKRRPREFADLKYDIKVAQVRDYEGVTTKDLKCEDLISVSPFLTPEEVIKGDSDSTRHFQIDLKTFENTCVEITPDGYGSWLVGICFRWVVPPKTCNWITSSSSV